MKLPGKKSDLNPPLGWPGGPCQVIQRIHETIRNPRLREELVDDVEGYKGLSNADAAKVYKIELEKGGKPKFMQRLRITPHAQYRMDQRNITVPDVRVALNLFAKKFYDSKSQQGIFYRERSEDLARGEKILWVAKPIGRLAIVFVGEGQGTVTLVTAYWEGKSDPKPVDESVCRVAERFALRQEPPSTFFCHFPRKTDFFSAFSGFFGIFTQTFTIFLYRKLIRVLLDNKIKNKT